jgi:hypothetical protein
MFVHWLSRALYSAATMSITTLLSRALYSAATMSITTLLSRFLDQRCMHVAIAVGSRWPGRLQPQHQAIKRANRLSKDWLMLLSRLPIAGHVGYIRQLFTGMNFSHNAHVCFEC